ncbi:MAG: site-specific integrase [Candidatus Competibacteraceae bacterium]|nr:site-specific integrase [Candidatus Competibacteraceae bacterium]
MRGKKYWGLEKRGRYIRIRFTTPSGRRVCQSAGTSDWDKAAQLRDQLKAATWSQEKLGERPAYTWESAVVRWFDEQESEKTTINKDREHLRFATQHLAGIALQDITPDMIRDLGQARLNTGVKPATVNRMLEVIRAILRRAEREWRWIDTAPAVRLLRTPKRRIRWLTHEEAERLLAELPPHLEAMARFSLNTGLRASNVTGLQWNQVDIGHRRAWIHQDEFKGQTRALAVPLNDDAVRILREQVGQHPDYVFVYDGHPVTRPSNHAWRKALKRAGIENFRWHDLRHTWASWLVQAGTPLHVLQELGGWSSYTMVLRYAHLSSSHLLEYSNMLGRQEGKQRLVREVG